MISFRFPLACAAAFALCGCTLGVAPDMLPQVLPVIAYTSSPCDTVGRPAFHPPVSSGSIVASYLVSPEPPAGLTLNSATGIISGTPTTPSAPKKHTVIGMNVVGSDTATIRLCVVPAELSATAPPWIAYDSPSVDTMGAPATHPVVLLGGQVTSFALLAALPAGLSLNIATGLISGTPTTAQSFVDYSVVATGPGGKDTAVIRLAVINQPVPFDSVNPVPPSRPLILYDSPASDTVGVAVSHPVLSLGGPVTSYALLKIGKYDALLPDGLSLNTSTGLVSGTPTRPPTIVWLKGSASTSAKRAVSGLAGPSPGFTRAFSSTSARYAIVATGPGGKDTAEFAIEIVWYDDSPILTPTQTQINLTLNIGTSQGIALSRLIVTLTSNAPMDTVIRDTIVAGTQGFQATTAAQTFTKSYAVRPLRHWTIEAKTIWLVSIVAQDSVLASNVLVGESRNVTMNLVEESIDFGYL